MNGKLLSLCIVGALLVGCKDDARQEESLRLDGLRAKDVLAQVGEFKLTYGELKTRIDFEVGLKDCLSKAKMSAEDEGKFRAYRVNVLMPELINTLLIRAEAKRCGVEPTDDAVARHRQEFERTIAPVSFSEAAKRAGVSEAAVNGYMRDELRQRLLMEKLYPDLLQIDSNVVAEVRGRIAAFDARATASNAVIRTTAERVIKEVRGGLDFAEAAKRYSYRSVEDGEEWGDFSRDELVSDELCAWAFAAKVGDVGGPFEYDDGLIVVKVLGHSAGATRSAPMALDIERVSLVRIVLPICETLPQLDDDALKRQIRETREAESLEETLKRLQETLTVEYPNGTNFTIAVQANENGGRK